MTRRSTKGLALTIALLLATATHAAAQTRPSDGAWRWEAFVGCWQPVANLEFEGLANRSVCLVPGAQPDTIERFVIVDNRVVTRERVDSTDRHPSIDESCPGWEQAEWSADARRVYRRGEYLCPGGITRATTGLMALTSDGDWLDVMSVASGETTGVRVMRYRPSYRLSAALPAETIATLEARSAAARTAQTAASAPVSVKEIVDVAAHVTSAVTQAWLSELGQPFTITAADLLQLAEAGVHGNVTDVIVALAYPKVFALKAAGAPEKAIGGRSEEARAVINPYDCGMNMAVWVPGWNGCEPAYYGFSPYGPGFGYGYGGYGPLGYGRWYAGGGAAIIVIDGGGPVAPISAPPVHGRVVKGEGYTQGRSPLPTPAPSSDSSSSSSSTSSSGSSDSGGGSSSSGSSAPASSGGERTAHPR